MAADVSKHLERAKKYLEKSRLAEAVREYEVVLEAYPANQEVMQTLGDLYAQLNDPRKASHYYGMLFDRLVEVGDATKAAVLYTRFLKPTPQPPERMARFAMLQQRQNKPQEAIELYRAAAELYLSQKDEAGALGCWDKIAQLEPDNEAHHLKLGEVGERLGKAEIAARGYLRAGQLALADGRLDGALDFFARAHRLAPGDRSAALMYAGAQLRKGDAAAAVQLLEPFAETENDPAFLEVYGEAAMRAGQFDRAQKALQEFYKGKTDGFAKLFELAHLCVQAGQEPKAIDILGGIKERMFRARQQTDFGASVDRLVETNPKSVVLAEYSAKLYSELNRESKYFDILSHLFDLYVAAGEIQKASDALDNLVDIDPYDINNEERMKQLEGRVDAAFLRGISARMAKAAGVHHRAPMTAAEQPGAGPSSAPAGPRGEQSMDDLLVQAEIFMQYSLQPKAIERLQKFVELFPAEVETNERLRNLFQATNWWPAGVSRVAPAPQQPTVPPAGGAAPPAYSAETLTDLSKISEISSQVFRQAAPKAVLSTAVNEIGSYLRATRCLAAVGPAGQPPQMAAEYCAPGVSPSPGAQVVKLLGALMQLEPDPTGGLHANVASVPALRELGLESALGVQLVDKDSQTPAGLLVVASQAPRTWRPNESVFLQAVGDQMLLSVNHTKMRTLMRSLAVADERTGLLGRSSYLDCLLTEVQRAKTQNTPVSLAIFQVDRGPELVRKHGEGNVAGYLEQLARLLQPALRQNDLAVKYTAYALAFVLPDTNLANARVVAEKLKKASTGAKASWNQDPVTLSAAAVEAITKSDYDAEDIVTELINRVESGLEQARQQGGDTIVAPEFIHL